MRAVLQRVDGATLTVGSTEVSSFEGQGIMALVGVTHGDGTNEVDYIVRKIAQLRLLDGEVSVSDAGAPVLVVSQFTLYAAVRKGRRPSWNAAAPGEVAEPLVEAVAQGLEIAGVRVLRGRFGATMRISMTADGPVTVIVDTVE